MSNAISTDRIQAAAEAFLASKGCEILATNFRTPGVDIQMAIIAMDPEEQTLIFADVASSYQDDGDGFAEPSLARWEAELLCGAYLAQHGDEVDGGTTIRFDAISIMVTASSRGVLRWHKAAFSEA